MLLLLVRASVDHHHTSVDREILSLLPQPQTVDGTFVLKSPEHQ